MIRSVGHGDAKLFAQTQELVVLVAGEVDGRHTHRVVDVGY